MKRLRLWLRELNLTQQLTTLVFFAIAALTIFIFAFLSPRIKAVTSQEVFRLLHNSASAYTYYLNRYPDDTPNPENQSVGYYVYDESLGEFSSFGTMLLEQEELQSAFLSQVPEGEEYLDATYTDKENGTLYYCINRLDDHRLLICCMNELGETQLRDTIVSQIVNMNMIIAMALFIILTVWVASLILPLNQIKQYINKIKSDEPAALNVNRRDEIGEVADALVEMEDMLQKQSREKQEMIQNISHDLKTPIATIRSYSESIKDGIYPYGTLERSCDVIIENANRLDKKVRSLIALNKMEYLLDDCEKGDHLLMAEVIDKALLSLQVIKPDIEFQTDIDRNVLFHGDGDPWRTVVENLIDNALRYAKSYVRIELHPGELKVINDGSQIEEDRLSKLFKPYEKGTDGQFGLGLSIVYRIVTTYGYKVEADNLTDAVSFRIWKELPKKEVKAYQKKKKAEEKEIRRIEMQKKKEEEKDA